MGSAVAACIAFLAGIAKAVSDENDKKFLKNAVTSTLVPTNPQFTKIEREIDQKRDSRGMNSGDCYHRDNGDTICFFFSTTDPWKNATVVFNRGEVAQIYANQLDRENNRDLIKDQFDHKYEPVARDDDWDEEFVDRIGVLGTGICFSKNSSWEGADYNYSPRVGIVLRCGVSPNDVVAQFSSDDLKKCHKASYDGMFSMGLIAR